MRNRSGSTGSALARPGRPAGTAWPRSLDHQTRDRRDSRGPAGQSSRPACRARGCPGAPIPGGNRAKHHEPDGILSLFAFEAQRLSSDLRASGWRVLSIDLHKLLLARLRAQGDEWLARRAATERALAKLDQQRGLNQLRSWVAPLVEGPDGLAGDCSRLIC